MAKANEWIEAGTLSELKEKKSKVIRGGIAVFFDEGELYAVDNRCPHMGFPLQTGTMCDGMLTCHWHHARFDACSGGTLDPWADDVPVYEIRTENDNVFVSRTPKAVSSIDKQFQRLKDGLEQNLGIVIAKAIVALMQAGVDEKKIAETGIVFGTTYRSAGWGSGLTILSAMVNIMPKCDYYGKILALFHGLRSVASDCAGSAPRFMLQPLPDAGQPLARLISWYRQSIEVRDAQGAGRILQTAIRKGHSQRDISKMMLSAVTDHFFLDGGHTLDFHNKAFEALEHVDEEHVELVLTSLVPLLRNPSRSEEIHSWQYPINLVEPTKQAFARLDQHAEQIQFDFNAAHDENFHAEPFVEQLLSDKPLETIEALSKALISGVSPVYVAKLLALAAAERIVRFHTQNDFSDWDTALHAFTHAHAVHESLRRDCNLHTVRALYYAAISIYLERFLNIPSAKKPNPEQYNQKNYSLETKELLDIMNERQQVVDAAEWVSHYIDQNGEPDALFNTLTYALLREDGDFHSFQMLEAALVEYDHWDGDTSEYANQAKSTLLIALTRYLAAHAPSSRNRPHVATIAWRLYNGEELFEETSG